MTEPTLPAHEARQRLYEIVRSDVSFEEKAEEALELGKQYLAADNAHLTQIDQETDHWKAIVSTDSANGKFPPGLELDLGTTYCRRTLTEDAPIALTDAPNQGWADDPAFETHGLHCYHGTTLIVNGEPFGTICFVAEEPRSEQFSDGETMFAELLTRMLERELEREQHEVDLKRQTNLSTVLNRVLRHNLRNDMSVIRGFTALMADRLENDPYSNIALSNIDKLISLSEKARELDRVVGADFEREPTEIVALVSELIDSVEAEYPEASITLDYDKAVTAAVFPSFARAVEELIENAAKHGGESPRITVAIEPVSNAVEIQISDEGPGLADHEANVLKTGTETPLTHGSGLGLWLAHWIVSSHGGSITPTRTEDGTCMTVSIPRKQTAETTAAQKQLTQLTRARDQYQAAFEEASDAMVILNDDARILDANPEAASFYELDRQNLLGRSPQDLLPDNFNFEEIWQELQTTGSTRGTATYHGGDGVDRTIEYSAQADIIPGQHLFIGRDITDRTEQQRELSRLKQRYETLLDAAPNPIFVADGETEKIIEVNKAAETLIGAPRNQIVGEPHLAFHPSEDEGLYRNIFEQSMEKQGSVRRLPDGSHVELLTADGDTVPVEYSIASVALPDAPVIVGIFRDISEQIKRERALKEITQRLTLALEGTDTGVWDWNIETDEVRWSESLEGLLGLEPNTFEGTFDAFAEYLHPEDRQRVTAAIEEAIETESRFQIEFRIQCEDDTLIWVESRGEVYDNGDDPKRMLGILTDITERKEHEAEIDESIQGFSNIYKLAYESALAGIAIADLQGQLCKVNSAFIDMWGYDQDEVIGRSVTDFWDDPVKAASVAKEVIERGEWEGTLVAETKDGSTFEARVSASIVANEEGEPSYIMSSFIDLSEHVSRERELQHKNEQLEQFASVISHDLRNPLTVAQGRVELAQTEHESEHLQDAASALDRMQAILNDVLVLAREGKAVGETEPVDLAAVIDTCWKTVDTKEATLSIETQQTIQADCSRLKQVVENLFRNAVEHGGDDVTVTVGDLEDGFYIADDGPGIPEENRERIFEAGYSTAGEGTGFGLQIVRKIATAHGWNVRVTESGAGGARFEIIGVEFTGE